VRKRIARRRGDTKAGQGGGFESQLVADIIETDGMRELGEEHRGQMTGDAEAA
jgi:hypothetical protein